MPGQLRLQLVPALFCGVFVVGTCVWLGVACLALVICAVCEADHHMRPGNWPLWWLPLCPSLAPPQLPWWQTGSPLFAKLLC